MVENKEYQKIADYDSKRIEELGNELDKRFEEMDKQYLRNVHAYFLINHGTKGLNRLLEDKN